MKPDDAKKILERAIETLSQDIEELNKRLLRLRRLTTETLSEGFRTVLNTRELSWKCLRKNFLN